VKGIKNPSSVVEVQYVTENTAVAMKRAAECAELGECG
jgi:hypothetical protein